MGAYGLNAIHPVDNPHIIAMAAARTVETDLVLDIRNGPDAADRILGIQKDGEIWAQDGSATDPTYTFEDDIDSGFYRIGANNVGLALGGSKVVDYGTGGVAVTGTLSATGAVTIGSTVYPGTFTAGDLLYASGANTLAKLAKGTARQLLQMNAGATAPEWASNIDIPGTLDVTGATTLDGTLAVTGVSTLSGRVETGAVLVGINESANANMTTGLTINQGAAADEILALKSSDVAHKFTTVAEADTYVTLAKNGATVGGLLLRGFSESTGSTSGLAFQGYMDTADTAKTTSAVGVVQILAGEDDGSNGRTTVTADGNLLVISNFSTTRFIFDAEGTMHSVGATATDQIGNGLWFINETANANMTIGLTINQGANDDHILAFKSSDVATGLTTAASDTVETDDYGTFTKIWPAEGGLRIQAMAEDAAVTTTLALHAFGGTAGTDKTTAAGFGLVDIRVHEHDGANSLANITADGNVFSISAKVAAGILVRLLVDEDGDLYSVTAAQTFDREDDLALVRALDLVRGDDVVRQEWDDFVRYNEADLIRLGILGAPVSEGGMTNVTQLQRLHNGALVQLHTAHRKVESRTEKLEGVLRDLLAQNSSLEGREQALALLEA